MMMDQIRRQVRDAKKKQDADAAAEKKKRQEALASGEPDDEDKDFMYYSPFCYEITKMYMVRSGGPADSSKKKSKKRKELEFMECGQCGNQGSTKPQRCCKCNQNVHVYRNPVGDMLKNTIPLLRKLGQQELNSFLPIE